MDEDFLMGLDQGINLHQGAKDFMNENTENFYDKLAEYNSSWMDLEGLFYKCSKTGGFDFTKDV